ncbi:hypothetical protein MKW92_020352 [Papaver armeniacum]|nr:hypothetical protein MKW92_020352 [Papaver armeniacum]
MESLSINSPKNDDLDPWDSINSLDDTHRQEGIDAGYKDGLISGGKEDWNQVGLISGFEVGEELGYYQGCLDVWNSAIKIEPNCFSSRIQDNIKQLNELIKTYHPESEKVQEIMNALRLKLYHPENENVEEKIMNDLSLKFKPTAATLSVKLEHGESLDF